MKTLRLLLFPFALLYGCVVEIRNFLFSSNLYKSTTYKVHSIGIGNLSTGGTGKSAFISYLISKVKDAKEINILSRGYGRKTKGVLTLTENSTSEQVGDEPLMIYKRYHKEKNLNFVVSGNRKEGMEKLQSISKTKNKPLYFWDDCMQHRWVKPKIMVLLTTYKEPFSKDWLLPMGNLRERRKEHQRADAIVVTKCPKELNETEKKKFKKKLGLKKNLPVLFSQIVYADFITNGKKKIPLSVLKNIPILVVSGIAKPSYFINFLIQKGLQFNHINYADHHHYTEKEMQLLFKKSNGSMILTTEKDYVKLVELSSSDLIFYLPITMGFDKGDERKLEKLVFS